MAHYKFVLFAIITNAADSSLELQVLCEKGKFTIKDSILTKVNNHGKKEKIATEEQLSKYKHH